MTRLKRKRTRASLTLPEHSLAQADALLDKRRRAGLNIWLLLADRCLPTFLNV